MTEATSIPPELVERMVALVQRCADSAMAAGDLYTMREATAIVAQLPEPVDPDVSAAQQVLDEYQRATCANYSGRLQDMVSGLALAAIRRGRALAREKRA